MPISDSGMPIRYANLGLRYANPVGCQSIGILLLSGVPSTHGISTDGPGVDIHETTHAKSIAGIAVCLGGVGVQMLCLHQHLTAPDSTAAEVSAAGIDDIISVIRSTL